MKTRSVSSAPVAFAVSCLIALLAAGCGSDVVNGWQSTWGSGSPAYSCPGFAACVAFPSALGGGSLNDLQYNSTAQLAKGSVLSVSFQVSTPAASPADYLPANGETGLLRATLMLDQRHDNNQDIVARWYCTGAASGTYILRSADNTPQTLSCPLAPFDAEGNAVWTDIDGQPDARGAFEAVLADMGSINVVFGGDGGLAHGVAVSGTAVWQTGLPVVSAGGN